VYEESPDIKRLWPFLGGAGRTDHRLARAKVARDDEGDEDNGAHAGRRVYNQWCPGGLIGNFGCNRRFCFSPIGCCPQLCLHHVAARMHKGDGGLQEAIGKLLKATRQVKAVTVSHIGD